MPLQNYEEERMIVWVCNGNDEIGKRRNGISFHRLKNGGKVLHIGNGTKGKTVV